MMLSSSVRRRDLFGLSATGTVTLRSDIDFWVYGYENIIRMEEELLGIDMHDSANNDFVSVDMEKQFQNMIKVYSPLFE